MPTGVLLPQFLLPLAAVNLGRFVISIDEPHIDYHDPLCDMRSDVTGKVQTKYDSTNSSVDDRSFASQLTSFLSSTFSKRAATSVRITSDQVNTYFLNNTGKWFEAAVEHEETRKWIERMIDEGEDIYVVIGYYTLVDAHIVEQTGGRGAFGVKAILPVSAALTAIGVVIPFGGLTNPGVEAYHGRMEDEQRQFIAQGEQICAVQYRKVRHSWFASNKVDKTKLVKETLWKRYDQPRDVQDDEEDMIGVDLDDNEITPTGEYRMLMVDEGRVVL
jgi:hypothetical protein